MTPALRPVAFALGAFVLLAGAAGCATSALSQARTADELRQYDVAVAQYTEAVRQHPNDREARFGLDRAKLRASEEHLLRGRRLAGQGRLEDALAELQLSTELNPTNSESEQAMREIRANLRRKLAAPPEGQTSLQALLANSRDLQPYGNQLPDVKLPPSITTGRQATSRELYRLIGDLANLTVTFDSTFREAPAQPSQLSNLSVKQALDTIALSTDTFYRVIGQNAIIVVNNTPAKQREYQEEVVRQFVVQNADLKETMDALRVVTDIRNIQPVTGINALLVRDSPERLRVVARFLSAFDKARPEIVVDIEVLEVNRTKLQEYGVQIASPGSPGIDGSIDANREGLSLASLRSLSRADFLTANIPALYYRLLKTESNTRTLASPHIRMMDGVPATANFGESVPVPQTTLTPIIQGGSNIQPQTTFVYKTIGVNIGMTPRTHANDEVTLALAITLSSIAGTGFDGLPTFGTRDVQTTIRLRDGETNILAGLIRDDERTERQTIPGLGAVPVLGKMLFAKNHKDATQTDVVVMLTPHIIRGLDLVEEDLRPLLMPREGSGAALADSAPVMPPPPIVRGGGGAVDAPTDLPPSLPVSPGAPTGLPSAPVPAPAKIIKR